MRPIDRIILHHSASAMTTTAAQIRSWHLERGWSDIGYHGVVESDGTWVPGRDVRRIGAHARGANSDSVGLCLVGDNTIFARRWTENQLLTLTRVVRALWLWWPHAQLFGHREVGTTATECPGVELRDVIPELMEGRQ